MRSVNICNKIHFTLYKKRIGLADEAGNKVSDKVRLEVYNQQVSEQVIEQLSNKVRQNVKL